MSPICSKRFFAGRKARSATLRTIGGLSLSLLVAPPEPARAADGDTPRRIRDALGSCYRCGSLQAVLHIVRPVEERRTNRRSLVLVLVLLAAVPIPVAA